jgi:hypothetical protein
MKRLAAGMLVVPVLVAAACDSSRTATPRPRHRKPAGRPMWWYHGYPPHDEIRLRGDVHSVVVGLGKVWALESDLNRGVTRLVRIEPRRDSVDRRAALRRFEPPLAVGAGLVWTLSGTRCRGSSGRAWRPRRRFSGRRAGMRSSALQTGPAGTRTRKRRVARPALRRARLPVDRQHLALRGRLRALATTAPRPLSNRLSQEPSGRNPQCRAGSEPASNRLLLVRPGSSWRCRRLRAGRSPGRFAPT